MNDILFRTVMKEKGITVKKLAQRLDMSYLLLSLKIDGEREFSCSEIEKLADILGKKEICFIFFV